MSNRLLAVLLILLGLGGFLYLGREFSASLERGWFPGKRDTRIARGTPRYPLFVGIYGLGLGMCAACVLGGAYRALQPSPESP